MVSRSPIEPAAAAGQDAAVCLFLGNNKIVVRDGPDGAPQLFATGAGAAGDAAERLREAGFDRPIKRVSGEGEIELSFAALEAFDLPEPFSRDGWRASTLLAYYAAAEPFPELAAWVALVRRHAIRAPYLYFNDNDYIYRFRAEAERNRGIYQSDARAVALYHSDLCEAIKAVKRLKERSATAPALLDFGAAQYLLPSHFGFCLGVQNAIERAYETLAANPGKRVFMLSELIHNPFVNEDLRARGLRYLQSDKGAPTIDESTGRPYWETLDERDVVIIPAFGARDEDKLKLVERGLPIRQHDATCMLVEKVWKAARRYGQQGYTVVIHGKAEHEETKATFSNSAKYAPSIVVRDRKEAEGLAGAIAAEDPEEQRRRFAPFAAHATPGFDPARDLERLAVVNQTTLLRNETLGIIELLQNALERRYGAARVEERMAMSSKGDTLCYATQVNQDALAKALEADIDVAIVVGGKNSSNTFQLFRLCQQRFGERAFYIQSEANILSPARVRHFVFPYDPSDARQGVFEERPFLPDTDRPLRILLTGGASCPDGILQQIICRINGFFPPERVRSVEDVLADAR